VQQSSPEQYEKALMGRRLAQGEESLPLTSVIEKQDARVAEYIQHLAERVSAARKRGNLTMLREHLEIIGHVHETARAWPQAAVPLRELCDLYSSLGDFTNATRAYRRLGFALLRTEHVRAAREALQKGVLALRGLPRGAALKARAQLFELLGMACLRDGLPGLALRYLRDQALPDRKLLKAPLGTASTMSRMGLVYSALGEPDKALASILDGLRIRYSTNAKTDTGRSLYSLGIVHQQHGELVLAAFVFRVSLRWQEGSRGRVAQARAHLDLAEVFKDLLIEKHRIVEGTITFRQFRFPNQREKSLLTEIIEESFPEEMDSTLSALRFSTLAHFHYRECLRLAGDRLDQRLLRIAEARLATLDNTLSPL
jgi:tetratricopeptide (TPR) repeat protein